MSLTLLVDDGRLPRELVLVGTTLVGRDPECEISHADPRLSRRHAEFRVTSDGVRLRDLGSRNGTLVNGHRVDEIVLTPGDVVQIAHLTIRFNDADADPTVHMVIRRPRGWPRGAPPPLPSRTIGRAWSHRRRRPSRGPPPRWACSMPLDDRTRMKLAAPAQAPRTPSSAVRPAVAFSPSSVAVASDTAH